MSETWTISAGSRVYGPYSAEQMLLFRDQGRLAAHSLVARTGADGFYPAGEDPHLANLFPASQPVTLHTPQAASAIQPHKFGRETDPGASGERNRYVIVADMKSGSINGLDEEIAKLGHACHAVPQAWILTSEITLTALRTAITQKLGKLDNLVIVDVTHDKAVWFNFGPETEIKLRSLWSRPEQRKAG